MLLRKGAKRMAILESLSMLGIILMIAGFILVGIEMVLPGFSFPGITGIICLVMSIFINAQTIEEGIIITIIIIAILGVMLTVILGLLSKGKLAKPIISKDLNYLLGKKGVASTDLRPSGVGDFEGVHFDVITTGNYIVKGTPIIITEVKGSKLIVKENRK